MGVPTVFLVHSCDIESTINQVVQRLNLTSIIGTFVVGETVTGGTSEETATVYEVGATYLLLTALSGDFTSGETITGEGGATGTASGTNYDAVDSFGVPIVSAATQSGVACRFVGFSGGLTRTTSGEIAEKRPAVLFSSAINVYVGDKITGNSAGYTSEFTAQSVKFVYEATQSTVYMKKVTLEAID